MFGMLRGGIGGLIIIGGVIYFSGAGTWLADRVKALDEQCYMALTEIGFTEANPVCAALSDGLVAMDNLFVKLGSEINAYKDRIFGSAEIGDLGRFTDEMKAKLSEFASSGDALERMIAAGPQSLSGMGSQPLQQAIDSFSIGQNLMAQKGMSDQAVSWLKLGANQPQGLGVMSQLSLGNVYANGANGITANPAMADYYLKQANNSLTLLTSSNTQQSRQMLGALPVPPDQLRREIERSIQQLRPTNR